jgi:hypothetical protein
MLILWAVIFVVAAGQNLYRTLIIIDVAAAPPLPALRG